MDAFEILADPRRRAIVELLSRRDRTVGELCEHFEISQPAVSRHLRVLRQSGLVRSRSRAQRRIYTLTPEPLDEITRWLQQHRAYWQERLDDLGTVLAAQSEAKREARR